MSLVPPVQPFLCLVYLCISPFGVSALINGTSFVYFSCFPVWCAFGSSHKHLQVVTVGCVSKLSINNDDIILNVGFLVKP